MDQVDRSAAGRASGAVGGEGRAIALTDWLPVGTDDGAPPPFLCTAPVTNNPNQSFYRILLGP